MAAPKFEALGNKASKPSKRLETFPAPPHVTKVVLESDEVTSLCPVTGQPDWETVRIEFEPIESCIESKSLKLYFWSLREEGAFCEELSARIAMDVFEACSPRMVTVTVTQKPRGGISISSTACYPDAFPPP